LELLQLTTEAKQLKKLIKALRKILDHETECDRIVAEELAGIRDRHGDDRRTTIEDEVRRLDVDVAVMVKDVEVVVGVTREGWIKRSSMASFLATGGTRKTSGVRPGDRMLVLVDTRTTHNVLVFSDKGMCYPIPVHQIPEAKWGEVGSALVNVCGMSREERLVDVIAPQSTADDADHLMFVTEQGKVKATETAEFESTRSAGILAAKLSDGDALSRVIPTNLKGDTILLSHFGQGIRFEAHEISVQGRSAKGVTGMKVGKGDRIQDVQLIMPHEDLKVAVFTRAGRAKLTPLDQFPKQRRGGKGVRMIISRVSNRHECVAISVTDGHDGFEVVDTLGHEHLIDAKRIPVTRRDGNAWTIVELKNGALVSIVEQLPAVKEAPAKVDAS
ncbi:MAG: topoisomerase-4 subunit A, partial [Myxococcota bacterium]